MAIISVSDVELMDDTSFDDDTYELISELINDVQGEVEGVLRRPIEPTTIMGETHVVDYMRPSVYLEKTPVTAISHVDVDGKVLDSTGFTVTPWGFDLVGYGVWFPGQIGLPGFPGPTYDPVLVGPMFAYGSPGASGVAGWPYPGRTFTVNYTAGLDGGNIPALRSLVKRNVLKLWTWVKEGDLARGSFDITVEDFQLRRSQSRITAIGRGILSPEDVALLDTYRAKRIG